MTIPGADADVAPSAMVTGATGGIGRAIAGRLARAGYRLTLSGRDGAALAKVASDLVDSDADLQAVRADMTAEDDVRALVRSHAERSGSMDLLVLSAGTGTSGRIAGYPMRRFDRQMSVNVRAPFALVQECLPALRRAATARPAHGARIAAIASMAGIAAEPGLAAYGAAKAALIADFSNVPGSVSLPFTSFPAAAFARLPAVCFVIPDLCDDMHDCSVAEGDAWLRAHIGSYADWAMSHDSLLILTWDEDDGSQDNHITTIFAGQPVRPGRYAEPISHYSVLATIEAAYALPRDGRAATATPITDI